MNPPLHYDEARKGAVEAFRSIIQQNPVIEKAIFIDDLFGKIRIIIWFTQSGKAKKIMDEINRTLTIKSQTYWTGEIWNASKSNLNKIDNEVYSRAFQESHQDRQEARLFILDRYRNRGGWIRKILDPPWEISKQNGPPIIVFYSFKGGLGRSTALAAFAVQRSRLGEHIVVIDADLDAPGVGMLLAVDQYGGTSPWGLADYLLEKKMGQFQIRDYIHVCAREAVTGNGKISVIPAGTVDENYPGKIARIDLEPSEDAIPEHPLINLLLDIKDQVHPDWILIDARSGLSEIAGLLISGIAHLYVILGTPSDQSWNGIHLIIERIGMDRIREGRMQSDCILVQGMVPESLKVAKNSIAEFTNYAEDEFVDYYYAEDPDNPEEDMFYYMRDMGDEDVAPEIPLPITYKQRLAFFSSIDEIAQDLVTDKEYVNIAKKIAIKCGRWEND